MSIDRHRDPMMRIVNGEIWLARRLSRFGLLLSQFDGITDSVERKHAFREAITSRGLEAVVCDIPNPEKPGKRKTITYGAAFERLYGEPL